MQQTEKYQFNLIEGRDDFSPNPLNENMEKVEAQFGTVAEQFTAVDEAMAQQAENFAAALGSGGNTCRIAYGSYTGTGTYGSANACKLTLNFRPLILILADPEFSQFNTIVFLRGREYQPGPYSNNRIYTVWGNDSITWYSESAANYQGNTSGTVYHYVVIGDNPA